MEIYTMFMDQKTQYSDPPPKVMEIKAKINKRTLYGKLQNTDERSQRGHK